MIIVIIFLFDDTHTHTHTYPKLIDSFWYVYGNVPMSKIEILIRIFAFFCLTFFCAKIRLNLVMLIRNRANVLFFYAICED